MDSNMSDSNVWDDTPLSTNKNTHTNQAASMFNSDGDDNNYNSASHYGNDSRWGESDDIMTSESPINADDNNIDEFKIQNELAHTMKSILLTNDNDDDDNNDNKVDNDMNTNIYGGYSYTDEHDHSDHVHYADANIHRKSDMGNPFLASSIKTEEDDHINRVDINELKKKKNELLNSLTKETNSHAFLKDPDDNDIDAAVNNQPKTDELFTLSPTKNSTQLNNGVEDSALENLLTLAGPDSSENVNSNTTESSIPVSSDRSSKYKGVVSPNRKIKMLRPRRINKSTLRSASVDVNKDELENVDNTSTTIDPLSAPLTANNDDLNQPDYTSTSPISRKQKFISESEAPLFNLNKEQILQNNISQPLSPSSSSSMFNHLETKSVSSYKYIDEDVEKFDITVGDPLKVGELTNAHVVYTINVKSKCDLLNSEDTVVTRRYSDFLWLYHQLLNNHPGFIIPPPPEKQLYGRFDDKFIENRRLGLENMLNRIAKRKVLQRDVDFIMFLQSENFAEDSKERESIVYHDLGNDNDSLDVRIGRDEAGSINTMAQILHATATLGISEASSSSGFFSSLIGLNTPKYVEEDAFILEKQAYIDSLDAQLRQLAQSLDMIFEKREELTLSLNDVSTVLLQMCDLEVNVEITEILTNFEELQTKIKELLDRSNISQVLTFGSTIDEYIRLIGSVRNCFENRLKICNSVATLKQHQEKKEHNFIKFKAKNQTQLEKIKKLESELSDINSVLDKQVKFKEEFDNIFKSELSRFEFDKIKDFKNMVEIYWESLIENQKLLIELWESFYDKCKFVT
jgi:sorting nexin-1/2